MENSHSTSYKKDLDKLEFGGNKFMALKLMKGSLQYKNQIIEMIKEWKSYNDTHNANTSPWAIFKNDYDDFEYYLNNLEISTADDGFVRFHRVSLQEKRCLHGYCHPRKHLLYRLEIGRAHV